MATKTASRRTLRLIITGASGRMGSMIKSLALKNRRLSITALIERANQNEFEKMIKACDVIVDFTSPDASVHFAQAAAMAKKAIVIGTTGFSKGQLSTIRRCAAKTAVFLSPNFSPGMNVVFYLAGCSAAALPAYDASIREIHHTQKKDSPSGTAIKLAAAVHQARPGSKPIPIVSQRIGAAVGDHTLTLAGPSERIELTHRAQSRDVFALGALDAARWIAVRKPGLYNMRQMLGLPDAS